MFLYLVILFKEVMTSINCVKAYYDNIVLSSNSVGKASSIAIGVAVIMWLLELYYAAYCIAPIILVTGYSSYVKYRNSYRRCLLMRINNKE